MKRVLPQPLMRRFIEFDCKEERENSIAKNSVHSFKHKEKAEEKEGNDVPEPVGCISLHKRPPQSVDGGEENSLQKYGHLRQNLKQKSRQMKASWALNGFIEDQLRHFRAHYSRGVGPTNLEDLSKLLMPKWTPPNELAALTWLGDWRPSSILDLVNSLSHSLPSLSASNEAGQLLTKLIHDIRIEEAVIDEEMAEIQANCILHLPFSRANNRSDGPLLACIHSEFKKIHSVIVKAQKLRFKVLELIVKKLLNQTDAVEFLVAFAGIQDSIHQIAKDQRMQKGSVCLSVKSLKPS